MLSPSAPMVSFAQNAEDVVLMRALADVERGFYVDVGAWDPEVTSVTKAFYDRGWSGINIEPQLVQYRALQERRPRDTNLQLVVSDGAGTVRIWIPRYSALATCDVQLLDPDIPDYRDAVPHEVRSERLNDVLQQHAGSRDIHFIKVDVEGLEQQVLAGIDLAKHRPVILLIEATSPATNAPTWHAWEPRLLANGYRFALFDGLNRFYLREESLERMAALAVPANCLDHFVSSREMALRERLASSLERARECEVPTES